MSVNSKMTAIADSIREKTGKTAPLTLDDMANGVNEVYDKGSADGWNEFLNVFTNGGERRNYQYAFAQTDLGNYTLDITPGSIGYMFYSYAGETIPQSIDCSNADTTGSSGGQSPVSLCAYSNKLKEFPDINIPPAIYWFNAFRNCPMLEKIEIIRVAENSISSSFTSTFLDCKKLSYVRFDGIIDVNISFQYSPLDVDSLKDVITHLKDYTGTTNEYAYTVTFKSTAFSALTAEGATSPNGNAWAEYIDDLKWNLTLA